MKLTLAAAALLLVGTGCMSTQSATEQPAATPTPAPSGSMGGMAMNADPDKVVANGGVRVPGWTGRVDPRAASQGAMITQASFATMGGGMHVTSGPAAIYWNPANARTGNYTVEATFTQMKAATHPEGYGVFVGGRDLNTSNQSYAYLLVRQDGKYFISHRANDSTTHKIHDWTEGSSVKAIDAMGKSTNTLTIRVDNTSAHYMVNGVEVHKTDRGMIDMGAGSPASAAISGIRVNHNLDVHIDGFSVKSN